MLVEALYCKLLTCCFLQVLSPSGEKTFVFAMEYISGITLEDFAKLSSVEELCEVVSLYSDQIFDSRG